MMTPNYDVYSLPWVVSAITGNAMFCVDLIIHLLVHGFKRLYTKKIEYILETVL